MQAGTGNQRGGSLTLLVLLRVFGQGVRSQIEDVRAGMLENVDKVLERGEKIEVRALSTSDLSVMKGLGWYRVRCFFDKAGQV